MLLTSASLYSLLIYLKYLSYWVYEHTLSPSLVIGTA